MAKIVLLLSTLVAVALATPVPVEDLGTAGAIYTPLQTYSTGSIISPGAAIVSPGVSTVYSTQKVYSGINHAYPVGYSGISGYGLGYNVIPIAHGIEQRRTIGYYH